MSRFRRYIGAVALAALAALLLIAPLPAGGQGGGPAAPQSFADVARAAATIRPSVVSVAVEYGEFGKAIGSGVVYKPGQVVTNAHVVEGAGKVTLILSDGSSLQVPPAGVRYDSDTDVAVLLVPELKSPAPVWANSDLVRVGELAVATGNPSSLRLRGTVTVGTISGTGRSLSLGIPLLQTDTPINPGNSGGPLVNLRGEVIGLNSAKIVGIGIEGLGFTIPGNVVRDIADRLARDGKIARFWLGMELAEAPDVEFGLPSSQGLIVVGVYEGRAGLDDVRVGDVLYTVDNNLVTSLDQLATALNKKPVGTAAQVQLRRGSEAIPLTVPWAEHPAAAPALRWETGIWRNLQPWQAEVASSLGVYLSQVSFDEAFRVAWLPPYLQNQQGTTVLLQTELMFLLAQYHRRTTADQDISQDVAQIMAGVVRGRLVVSGVGPPGSYTGTLVQGDKAWPSEPGPRWPEPGYPPALAATDPSTVVNLQFDSAGLDPRGQLELVLLRDGSPAGTFRWNLADMY